MKEIIINIQPFVLQQKAYIRDLEADTVKEEKIPMKDISHYLAIKSKEIECDKILLFGNKKISQKIQQDCQTKYDIRIPISVI